MSDPTTVNKTASAINDILKKIIEGASVDVIAATVIGEQPWLGLPIIKQVFLFILKQVAGYFYKMTAQAITSVVMDVQVNVEKSQVLAAFENLQMAIASGDKNAIEIASKDMDQAYGSLIHFDGAAPP